MRVLLTGGCGFIGSHFLNECANRGDDIYVLDRLTYAADQSVIERAHTRSPGARVYFEQIDLCNGPAVMRVARTFKPDVIAHFAAESHVDNSIDEPHEFIMTNVLGTSHVLAACRHHGIRLCHISTDEVYGTAHESDRAFFENDRLNPLNPYSATKAAGDLLVKAYANTYSLEHVIVRPSNNYGSGQNVEKFLPKLLACLDEWRIGNTSVRTARRQFPLHGDGSQVREWTYVKDTAKIVRSLFDAEQVWSSTYNLSSGINHTVSDTIRMVLKAYNQHHETKISYDEFVKSVSDRPGQDMRYWISSSKLARALSMPYTSFEIGLSEIMRERY